MAILQLHNIAWAVRKVLQTFVRDLDVNFWQIEMKFLQLPLFVLQEVIQFVSDKIHSGNNVLQSLYVLLNIN